MPGHENLWVTPAMCQLQGVHTIENHTLTSFRKRVLPVLPELAYVVLHDRTDRRNEERLGQWPADKGVLPSQDAAQNAAALWDWLDAVIGDAMLLHKKKGSFRLRAYGTKGHETLDNFTLVAEPDNEDSAEDVDNFDVPDDSEPASATARSADPAALVHLAQTMAERNMRLTERLTTQQMKIAERNQRSWESANTQLMLHLDASRQQLQDMLDVWVADRIEEGDKATRRNVRSPAAPSPLAAAAVSQIGEVIRTAIGAKFNVPPGLVRLLGHPQAKAVLDNPRLNALLDQDPVVVDGVINMLAGLVDQLPDPPAPGARKPAPDDDDDFDIPDPS